MEVFWLDCRFTVAYVYGFSPQEGSEWKDPLEVSSGVGETRIPHLTLTAL